MPDLAPRPPEFRMKLDKSALNSESSASTIEPACGLTAEVSHACLCAVPSPNLDLPAFAYASVWWLKNGLINAHWRMPDKFVDQGGEHPGLCLREARDWGSVPMLLGRSEKRSGSFCVLGVDAKDSNRATYFFDALWPLLPCVAQDRFELRPNETLPHLSQEEADRLRKWWRQQQPDDPLLPC